MDGLDIVGFLVLVVLELLLGPLESSYIPHSFVNLIILKFVKYTIRADKNPIKSINTVLLNVDFRIAGHTARESS